MFVKPLPKYNKKTGERYTVCQLCESYRLEDLVRHRIIIGLGKMLKSKTAKYGRSKEKRKDAKLIVLAIVINREGFLKYSNIFEGNMSDSKTLETIVKELSKQTSFTGRKPVVVIDAGIATDDNLKMLRKKHYGYVCVSRSKLKEYYADTDSTPVEIKDKRKQPIELMKVKTNK